MENKKNIVKEEELEKVNGGALAGLQFAEPTSPYANTTATETLAAETVSVSGAIAITSTVQVPGTPTNPILKGTPIKTK